MISGWYSGDFPCLQPWGCTDWTAEPYDPNCPSKHTHRGIDIGLPLNTALKAPVAGCSLTQVGYDPSGFGPNYPILSLPDGTQFLIGHTSSVVAPIGPLQVGATFAYSGNMGMSTGPHAHFQANASPGVFTVTKDPVPYVELGLEEVDLNVDQDAKLTDIWNALGGAAIANGVAYLPWSQGVTAALNALITCLLQAPPDNTADYLAWSRDVTHKLEAIEKAVGATA